MSEVFSGVLPLLVTSGFTSGYLMMLSVANLSGRFGMATLSDRIGCKSAYNAIIATLLPVYFTAPLLVQQVRPLGVGWGSIRALLRSLPFHCPLLRPHCLSRRPHCPCAVAPPDWPHRPAAPPAARLPPARW